MKKGVKNKIFSLMVAAMLAFSILGAGAAGLSVGASSGSTNVGGIIDTDTTWTAAKSPYIVVANILVNSGVTLTIEPDVEVKFDGFYRIQVDGELIAIGTSTHDIVFTSNRPSPHAGDWEAILFMDTSVDAVVDVNDEYISGSILRYCEISYGGPIQAYSSSPYIGNNYIHDVSGSAPIDWPTGTIWVGGSNSVIRDNTIMDNQISGICTSDHGGSGSPKILNNIIKNNNSRNWGGGIGLFGYGGLIRGNTVEGNTAERGGGIAAYRGNWVIENNSIINNTSTGTLGSRGGGGMYNQGDFTVTNCTISGNTASSDGGGISNYDSYMALTNVTIYGNSADASGGGIFVGSGTLSLRNTIVVNSTSGGDFGGAGVTSLGHNLDSDGTGGLSGPGDISGVDPLLGPLADNSGPTFTHALLPGSPAIDAGDDIGCPATDQRGVTRPLDGDGDGDAICDIGAYEYEPPPIEATEATIDFDPDTFNLCSEGKVVTVYIELPEGYDVQEIDISTVRLNGTVPALPHPTAVGDYDNDGIPDLMVKFDRAAVQSMLEPGDEVLVWVSGKLTGEICFQGSDRIRVIKPCKDLPVWYLDTETTPAGYEMEKGGGPGDDGQTGCVSIGPGNSVIWLADQAAVCDVTLPSGAWVVEIKTDSDWGKKGDKCEVSLGGWDTTTGWYDVSTTQATTKWNKGHNTLTILLQTGSATIYQGDYLALRIKNNDSGSHEVCTEGRSFLRSPDTDPGYPVPELAAGILLGLGFVGLAGYLGLRRRKGTDINA